MPILRNCEFVFLRKFIYLKLVLNSVLCVRVECNWHPFQWKFQWMSDTFRILIRQKVSIHSRFSPISIFEEHFKCMRSFTCQRPRQKVLSCRLLCYIWRHLSSAFSRCLTNLPHQPYSTLHMWNPNTWNKDGLYKKFVIWITMLSVQTIKSNFLTQTHNFTEELMNRCFPSSQTNLSGYVWLSLSFTASKKSILIGALIPELINVNECNWLSSALDDEVSNRVMSDWLSFVLPESDRFCTDVLSSTILKLRKKSKVKKGSPVNRRKIWKKLISVD